MSAVGGTAAVSAAARSAPADGISAEAPSSPEVLPTPAESNPDRPAGKKLPGQDAVARAYNGDACQVFVAMLIATNFLTNIVEKQIDPSAEEHDEAFYAFGVFYNVVFTIELLVNMYAHYFIDFWKGANWEWNLFDVTVVTIGVVNMMEVLPKSFNLLRMMRAFRVFRLFNRVKSLKKIISAIMRSIPGVINAFLILTIFMCIYAILAVELFKDVGEGCAEGSRTGIVVEPRPGFGTKRGLCMGQEYFGDFGRSIYTFFQVLTGESWSENVARPVIWYYENKFQSIGSSFFFVSFDIITAFVLTNVVLAFLLDKLMGEETPPDVGGGLQDTAPVVTEPEPEPEKKLTGNDLKVAKELGRLQGTLGDLGSSQKILREDFDSVKTDMSEMRDQIGLLVKALEQKYRLAAL